MIRTDQLTAAAPEMDLPKQDIFKHGGEGNGPSNQENNLKYTLNRRTLQGDNIPGEGRIPLEDIELAKEFWGWLGE